METSMRWLLLLALLSIAGCQNVVGPFERRTIPGRIDDPRLSISEQERKGRDQIALPAPAQVAPATYLESPWTRNSR
jgi:hypothetical protein